MATIHTKAHLEHGDFGFGNRNVVMRGSEEDGDVRIIDFNEAFEHTCERKMSVQWWAWEPHVADFGCSELYNVIMMLGVWTPRKYPLYRVRIATKSQTGIVPLLGDYYNIFRVPTVKRLVKWAMYNNKILTKEYIEPRAKAALAAYYEQYSERFERIGDPRRHVLPLLIPGGSTDNVDTPATPPPADAD